MKLSGDALPTAVAPVAFLAGLLRSVRASLLVLVVVVVVLTAAPVQVTVSHPQPQRRPMWLDSYSRRFPGCVSLVLWPAGRQPAAYLARAADGRLRLIDAGRAVPPNLTTMGACGAR